MMEGCEEKPPLVKNVHSSWLVLPALSVSAPSCGRGATQPAVGFEAGRTSVHSELRKTSK